jgi:DNA-binding NtrC family response regulator
MSIRIKVIIIDDDNNWLNILREIVDSEFKVKIEVFSSFDEAEKRLRKKPVDFTLLITDIHDEKLSEDKGFSFTKYADLMIDVPVIVVSGWEKCLNMARRDYGAKDAFFKGKFERLEFIDSVRKYIKPNNEGGDSEGNNHM